MKHLYHYLAFCTLFFFGYTTTLTAQLNVDTALDDETLIQSLAGEGVLVSNIIFDCPDEAYGWFECDDCNVGMGAGLLLTSGAAASASGPNDGTVAATGNGNGGDADLDQIPGVLGTQDACSVSFDVQAASDTLKFNYVFGSEEYLEFVGSFNDVFAFYIEGPGVPFQNIALLPGTSTIVSINNVNDVSNPEYYVDNGPGGAGLSATDDHYIRYDGFTVVLEAKIAIIPCETYTLRLVVADDLDQTLDSGVFIQAGSLKTSSIDVSATTTLADAGFTNAIEGCVDGLINFDLDIAPQDTVVIYFNVTGTATNGVDFVSVPDSIIVYPGDTAVQVLVSPLADGIEEGIETVKINITNQGLCSSGLLDSVVLNIQDGITVDVVPASTNICQGTSIQMLATGAINYQWSPPEGLSATNSFAPVATPVQSTQYMIIGNIGPCVDTTYAQINMDDNYNPNVPPEYNICEGSTVQLSATGGFFPEWTPLNGLSCYNCPDPVFNGTTTTIYNVLLRDLSGCQYNYPVTVNVGNGDLGLASQDIVLCAGEQMTLDLGNATIYTITPTTGLSCADCAAPILTATTATTYSITATSGTCSQTATINVTVNAPTVNAGSDQTSCETITISLGEAATANATYIWSPPTGLSNVNVANPTLDYVATTAGNYTYTVTVTDAEGCTATDAVTMTLDVAPTIVIAQPDTVVLGGTVSLNVGGAPAGSSYLWSPADRLSDVNSPNPIVTPMVTTTYTVTVTTPTAGCTSTASVTVPAILPPVLLIPSGFSPNGDGMNDFLQASGRDIAEIVRFEVFSRWGKKMYSSLDDPTGKGWDGKYQDTDQEIGVYAYFVEFRHLGDPLLRIQKGNVTLVR